MAADKQWKFKPDDIKTLIKSTLDGVLMQDNDDGNGLKEKDYDQKHVQDWANKAVEGILKSLQNKAERFKFVVTCTIMQRKGAGLHSTSSCLWDKTSDNCCSDKYETKTMYCIVSVFCLKC